MLKARVFLVRSSWYPFYPREQFHADVANSHGSPSASTALRLTSHLCKSAQGSSFLYCQTPRSTRSFQLHRSKVLPANRWSLSTLLTSVQLALCRQGSEVTLTLPVFLKLSIHLQSHLDSPPFFIFLYFSIILPLTLIFPFLFPTFFHLCFLLAQHPFCVLILHSLLLFQHCYVDTFWLTSFILSPTITIVPFHFTLNQLTVKAKRKTLTASKVYFQALKICHT